MHPYNKYRVLVPNKPSAKAVKKPFLRMRFKAALILLVGIFFFFKLINVHAAAATQVIKSGVAGYCIDDYKGKLVPGTKISGWDCNDTNAQNWKSANGTIVHTNNSCLSVDNDSSARASSVVLNNCNALPGQIWLQDQGGFFNPNSGKCLTFPVADQGRSLDIDNCNLSSASQQWRGTGTTTQSCDNLDKGQKIACFAEKEWTAWQAPNSNHSDLLNSYSDGNGYEQWCADFVSYVYKEAGYSFNQGERDQWDEYDANNIQYMGFTKHDASNYVPKTGDVAYFNYLAGHVEIVVSGGPKPTFVYGDSSNVDPQTGNGDMEANTITSEGTYGQVTYYLSPN
jgi:hypothetical protein